MPFPERPDPEALLREGHPCPLYPYFRYPCSLYHYSLYIGFGMVPALGTGGRVSRSV
jgi:hypothetical protein